MIDLWMLTNDLTNRFPTREIELHVRREGKENVEPQRLVIDAHARGRPQTPDELMHVTARIELPPDYIRDGTWVARMVAHKLARVIDRATGGGGHIAPDLADVSVPDATYVEPGSYTPLGRPGGRIEPPQHLIAGRGGKR